MIAGARPRRRLRIRTPGEVDRSRPSEQVNWHDRLGPRRYQRLHRARIKAQRVRVDVGENRRRAGVGDGVGGRDEGQIGNNHFVAWAQSQRGEREMQAGRAVADRERIFGAAIAGEIRLELIDILPDRRYPSGVQRIENELLLARSDQRFRNRDEAV